jgi:hypothetical protein
MFFGENISVFKAEECRIMSFNLYSFQKKDSKFQSPSPPEHKALEKNIVRKIKFYFKSRTGKETYVAKEKSGGGIKKYIPNFYRKKKKFLYLTSSYMLTCRNVVTFLDI